MRHECANSWWDGRKWQEEGPGVKSCEVKGVFGAVVCSVDTFDTISLQGAQSRRGKAGREYLAGQSN